MKNILKFIEIWNLWKNILKTKLKYIKKFGFFYIHYMLKWNFTAILG